MARTTNERGEVAVVIYAEHCVRAFRPVPQGEYDADPECDDWFLPVSEQDARGYYARSNDRSDHAGRRAYRIACAVLEDLNFEVDADCAYCGKEITGIFDRDDSPPEIGDDAAWDALGKAHAEGCEWIETRAHSRGAK